MPFVQATLPQPNWSHSSKSSHTTQILEKKTTATKKAFDRVQNAGTFHKLLKSGVLVQLTKLSKSFLTGRLFQVRVANCTSVKHLGVTLDSKLKFARHIEETCVITRCIRAALYPMLNQSSPIRCKMSIIKMYINSRLSFTRPAWGAQVSASRWKQIETVQNIALKTITRLPPYVKNEEFRKSLNFLTIHESVIRASPRTAITFKILVFPLPPSNGSGITLLNSQKSKSPSHHVNLTFQSK